MSVFKKAILGNLRYKLDFHYPKQFLHRSGISLVLYDQASYDRHIVEIIKLLTICRKLINICKVYDKDDIQTEFHTLVIYSLKPHHSDSRMRCLDNDMDKIPSIKKITNARL